MPEADQRGRATVGSRGPRPLLYAAGQQGLFQPSGTEAVAGPERVDEALGRLANASLLTFSTDDATVTAHVLTMRVALERQAQDGSLGVLGAGIAALLEAVTESLPEPWQNRPATRDAIQQIMALHEHLAPYISENDAALTETLLQLRGWALWSLNGLGDSSAQAIEYGQALTADRERILGETHPDTLISRNNLAAAYQAAGRLDQAIPLLERTVADREQVLGETHPDTLIPAITLATRTGPRGGWIRPFRSWNARSPTPSRSWARRTPAPWASATTSPAPTKPLGVWIGPSHSWSTLSLMPSGSLA